MRYLRPLLLLLVGCSQESAGEPPLLLRLSGDGSFTPVDFPGVPERGESNTDPVVIEVPSTATCSVLFDVLVRLSAENRANISLLLDSPGGASAVTLPIVTSHGCRRLHYYEGDRNYNEHEMKEDGRHLWIRAWALPGGAIHVGRLESSFYKSEIPDPASNSADAIRPKTTWTGGHPPLGEWSEITIRGFMSRPNVKMLSPFFDLSFERDDLVKDALAALELLRNAAPGRVIVSFRLAKSP